MQQQLLQPALFESGMPMQPDSDADAGARSHQAAARILYNRPSPAEKLTDSTLPLTWPAPYFDQFKAEDTASLSETAPAQQDCPPMSRLTGDYVQLMRKLQAESLAARQSAKADKALCAAHYASTLIAALAFVAMMGIVILTCFPSLLAS